MAEKKTGYEIVRNPRIPKYYEIISCNTVRVNTYCRISLLISCPVIVKPSLYLCFTVTLYSNPVKVLVENAIN